MNECPHCPTGRHHPIFRKRTTKIRLIKAIIRAAARASSQVAMMDKEWSENGRETMGGQGRAHAEVNEPQGPYVEVVVSWNFTGVTVGRE